MKWKQRRLIVNIDTNISGCSECIFNRYSEDGTYCGNRDINCDTSFMEPWTSVMGFRDDCPLSEVPDDKS